MRININHFVILFFGLLILTSLSIINLTYAQCNSKITAKTNSVDQERGEIIVEITTAERYICRLNSVSGKGIESIDSKNDNGSKTIKFSNLDKYKIYQVEVEFLSEEDKLCKKLQRNDLTFEP